MKARRPYTRAISIIAGWAILSAAIAGCQRECSEPTGTYLNSYQETRPKGYEPGFSLGAFDCALPVLVIDTVGATVIDEPKIDALLQLFDGAASHDLVHGPPSSAHAIGIELRGQISMSKFPKKQFGFEFRDANGDDLEVSILGMPADADWVLNGAYRDSTGLRNHIGYKLAAEISAWAPRTAQVEVFLNQSGEELEQGDYLGLFTLTEKVQQGAGRVEIEPLQLHDQAPPEITGGYLIEMTTRGTIRPDEKWFCGTQSLRHFLYVYPRGTEISDAQQEWIQEYTKEVERAIYHGTFDRASELLDMDALVDYTLINEYFRNKDGFYRSTFIHKSREGAFVMGPVWDLDFSSGHDSESTVEGWTMTDRAWVGELFRHRKFREQYRDRWEELRSSTLTEEHVDGLIQEAFEQCKHAGVREFERWEELPDPKAVEIPSAYPPTHEGEVDRLRAWLSHRGRWIDDNIDSLVE